MPYGWQEFRFSRSEPPVRAGWSRTNLPSAAIVPSAQAADPGLGSIGPDLSKAPFR